MKEQKQATFKYILVFVAVVIFFIVALSTARQKYDLQQQENIQLKNEKADVFCKSQSYEKVIEPEKILNSSLIIEPLKEGEFENFLNKTGAVERCSSYNNDYDICVAVIPAKTKTHSFETGYYNLNDNSFYCQAEPKIVGSDITGECILKNQDYCKRFISNERISCIQNICLKNITEYQKTEKFPYIV